MSTILPPPATPSSQPTAIPAPVVSVPSPPAALADLANGTALKAEIVAVLTRGLAEVETDVGNFQIRANVALRVGAELDLQLLRNGPQPQFAVRAIDGHALPGQIAGAPGGLSANSQGGTQPSLVQASGQPLQSAVDTERAAAASSQTSGVTASPAARPAPLVVGAFVSATLLPRPPGAETTPPPPSTVPAAPQTATGTSAAPINAPQTAIVQNLARLDPAGTRVELRLLSVIPPGDSRQPGVPEAAAGRAGKLTGTVTAFTSSGHPILETPAGLLSLDNAADVRIGTKVAFALMPRDQGTGDAAKGPVGFLDTFLQKRSWPALEQVLSHVAKQANETAIATGATSTQADLPIPQPDNHLARNLLSATAALAEGDIHKWLGDLADTLERDQPELFRRLNDDFAQLARIVSEPRTDDWRTALIPLFTGFNMEPVQMHMRGERAPKENKKKDGGGSRFIIDLNLSNLGRFQLDGFMKERGEARTFDLIVRTNAPLPQRMRHDLNRIFTDFTEVAGLIGGITFQAQAQFVEVPLPRGDAPRDGVVV